MTEKCSLRELAKMLGVHEKAVRNAVARGRLSQSVARTSRGVPYVADAALAMREWEDNAGKPTKALVAESAFGAEETLGADAGEPDVISSHTLNEAQRLATLERARKLRIENDLKRGRLVEAETVAKEAFESARVIREAMLNIPARIAAELAAETDPARVHVRLDAAIREALSMTADAIRVAAGLDG